jgi:hypothetical protein
MIDIQVIDTSINVFERSISEQYAKIDREISAFRARALEVSHERRDRHTI